MPKHANLQDDGDGHVGEKYVYLLPRERQVFDETDDIDFYDVWRVIWHQKRLIIAVTLVITTIAVAYSLLASPVYRSEVLLAPVDDHSAASGLMGQLDGLVGLAGLGVGEDRKKIDALAVLRSRDFTRSFIQEYQLVPVLFADEWDEEAQAWKASNPDDWPDIRDAVKFFGESVRKVREEGKTGLVTLAIDWSDPLVAANWANTLAQRLNLTLRNQTVERATANIEYLRKELEAARIVALQQAIGRLLESELQTLMLARGNDEFAFRVIDRAEEPKLRIWPMRSLIVALAFVGGVFASTVIVLLRYGSQRRQLNGSPAETREKQDR